MNNIEKEFVLARMEALEAKLRNNEEYWQQAKISNEAGKRFEEACDKGEGILKAYCDYEDELSKTNCIYSEEAYKLGFDDGILIGMEKEPDGRKSMLSLEDMTAMVREHTQQITSLEKKLSNQEQLNRELKQRLSDQEQYIKLLKKSEENEEYGNELPDISHVRDKRIAFIGGLPETIKKMKKEFYHAVFITDDTTDIPQKIDAMVMFPNFMSHSLFYKYIPLTREKGVQLVYCNSTNTDLILRKIGQELLTANA